MRTCVLFSSLFLTGVIGGRLLFMVAREMEAATAAARFILSLMTQGHEIGKRRRETEKERKKVMV
jgi:hypothetical protein